MLDTVEKYQGNTEEDMVSSDSGYQEGFNEDVNFGLGLEGRVGVLAV